MAPTTPSDLNARAAAAAKVPLPLSAMKSPLPSAPASVQAQRKALPTPIRRSINARLAKTPAGKEVSVFPS